MDETNYSVEDSGVSNYTEGNYSTSAVFRNPFQVPFTRVLFITCYVIVFATCILGNSLVLIAIARSPRLRSMTNFFLANLAVADFCVGVFCVLPNLSTFLSQNWILGKAMCKIYYYVWNVSYTASIVILTVIAVERYIAIIYPLKAKYLRSRRKLLISLFAIWSIALGYNIPYLVYYDILSFPFLNIEYCYFKEDNLSGFKGLSLASFFVWYIFPLSVIGILYFRISIKMWNAPISGSAHLQKRSSYGASQCSSQTSNFSNIYEESPIENHSVALKLQIIQEGQDSSSSDKAVKFYAINENTQELLQEENGSGETGCNKNEMRALQFKVRNASIMTRTSCASGNLNRERHKVIRLLITVVVTFALCVLPHHIKVLNHFWNIASLPYEVGVYFSPISFIILFLNSSLNPVLYALFSKNFRQAFKEPLTCLHRRNRTKSSAVYLS